MRAERDLSATPDDSGASPTDKTPRTDRGRKTLKLGLGGIGLMLYRRNSQIVQWVESPRSGISAKLESLTRTSGCELSYDAGDRLLFVTDGVTDQIGGPQNPRAYGYKRMQ